jgi:hypothetical protein
MTRAILVLVMLKAIKRMFDTAQAPALPRSGAQGPVPTMKQLPAVFAAKR